MADLLIDANARATAARTAGHAGLSDAGLAGIRSWYRGAVAKGIAGNQGKRTQIAKDGLRLPGQCWRISAWLPSSTMQPGRGAPMRARPWAPTWCWRR
ncbi:MAG: hypothetical protein ACRDOH_07950 [Streptosporangiaceae bacterium]